MSFYTLGISGGRSHDGSICLLKDNEVVLFLSIERTCRVKHQNLTNTDTKQLLNEVKKITRHINYVVAVFVHNDAKDDILDMAVPGLKKFLDECGLTYDYVTCDSRNHHLYHATSSFYTSGFNDAACIVIDGMGTGWSWDDVFFHETTSLFDITSDKITTLYKNIFYRPRRLLFGWDDTKMQEIRKEFKCNVDITNHLDIGMMYAAVTMHLNLGLPHDSGKTMGLSAYGEPNNIRPMLIDDTIISNNNLFRHDHRLDTFLNKDLVDMSEQTRRNLAYNVQKALEKVFIERTKQVLSLVNSNNLVLGGGCSMNILGNSLIKTTFPHLNVYADPIGGDATQSLGAVLFHYKRLFPKAKFNKMENIYFGPKYDINSIKERIPLLLNKYK